MYKKLPKQWFERYMTISLLSSEGKSRKEIASHFGVPMVRIEKMIKNLRRWGGIERNDTVKLRSYEKGSL